MFVTNVASLKHEDHRFADVLQVRGNALERARNADHLKPVGHFKARSLESLGGTCHERRRMRA